jgi:hypothetical protein
MKSAQQIEDEDAYTSSDSDEEEEVVTKGQSEKALDDSPKTPKSVKPGRPSSSKSNSSSSRDSSKSPSKTPRKAPGPPPANGSDFQTPQLSQGKGLPSKSPSSAKSPNPTPVASNKEKAPSSSSIGYSQHSGSSSSTRNRSNAKPSISSGQQQRKRRTRRLQWKKSVRVNVIPNLSYFSEQEKRQTWYTPDEYSLMEDECDLTSECMDANKPLWPGFCGRGLESWTIAGEQRKEQHVQLAIDIVWQAQLDQWRQASNTDECWEFIRSQYLQISKPCLRLANQVAQNDEKDIQGYLSSVKALEKSRRKMLGIRSKSSSGGRRVARGGVNRTVSDVGYALSPTQGPRRTQSEVPVTPKALKPAIKYTDIDMDKTPVAGSRSGRKIHRKVHSEASEVTADDDDDDDASTLASSIVEAYSKKKNLANKKIEFRPKSKTKVPTSPVGSLASLDTTDSSSTMRRLRSHMSVASDDSTRRRILRTAGLKNPL